MRGQFAILLGVLTLAGCTDPIGPTRCEATPFTVTQDGDTTVTSTGLKWVDGLPGTGPNVVEWCRSIAIHYEAYLADGTRFDSSRERDTPFIFTPGLGVLIDGLEQGVIGLRTEGTRRLIIPPALAFGAEGRRDAGGQVIVPGNATVIYDIEVLLIQP
jgi:FKBP-type peptidyl-prolyl cis-trans isomerase